MSAQFATRAAQHGVDSARGRPLLVPTETQGGEAEKNELFPIASGLIVGAILPLSRPRMRVVGALVASVLLGVVATVISGEYKSGWEFLLIDIPLVAVCAVASFLTVRAAQRWIATARANR